MTLAPIDTSDPAPFAERSTAVLSLLESRWSLRLLLVLTAGPQRFVDLRAAIPSVSANLLTVRLREMQDAGLVIRRYLPPPAASHVYELAPACGGLSSVLDDLRLWLNDFGGQA